MPNYAAYKDWQRRGDVTGLAVHHSATASKATGEPVGDARAFFSYHVNVRGWTHGAYHYVVLPDGVVQYALDEKIAGFHAGFKDAGNVHNLEAGQYWNNHYLAVCLVGYFEKGRTWIQGGSGAVVYRIPDVHTTPTMAQMESLLKLAHHLMGKYGFPVANVRGHRELVGCNTRCPGFELDLDALRRALVAWRDDAQATFDCCPDHVAAAKRRDWQMRPE